MTLPKSAVDVASRKETGWTQPLVMERYERYMRDHNGELDVANLCETIAQWSANRTVEALVSFSDIGPQLGRLEQRLGAMRRLIESLTGGTDTI